MKIAAKKGFTLIEILIAMMVFAIIAVIITSSLQTIFNVRERIQKKSERIAEIQIAMSLLQQDFSQAIDRPISLDATSTSPVLLGGQNEVEFTRGGITNPNFSEKRPHLARLSYFIEGDQLIRRTWSSLDRDQNTLSQDRVILNNVSDLQIRYFTKNNLESEGLSQWPQTEDLVNRLPLAISLSFSYLDQGRIQFYFICTSALNRKENDRKI